MSQDKVIIQESAEITPEAVKNASVNAIRYLHEVKKLSYSQIADKIGKSKSLVIKIRWGKWWPESREKQWDMLHKLEEIKEEIKEDDSGATH